MPVPLKKQSSVSRVTPWALIAAAVLWAFAFVLPGCTTANVASQPAQPVIEEPDWLLEIVRSTPELRGISAEPERYRLQVLVGEIETDPSGTPRITHSGYRTDREYFYPASTVKLMAAVAALNQLREFESEAAGIGADSALAFHALFDDEVYEGTDESNLEGGTITTRHEIRKIFLVSDNRAFNRMYELVGQGPLNEMMRNAGLDSCTIVHRLSEGRTAAQNRMSPRITITGTDEALDLPERTSATKPVQSQLATLPGYPEFLLGRAYTRGSDRFDRPFEFATKNRVSLLDLQRAVALVCLPGADHPGQNPAGFGLHGDDTSLLMTAMHQYPGQSENPRYDPDRYPDDWGKFFLPGVRRVLPEGSFKVYNKLGRAYGFSSDTAMIRHEASGRTVLLAMTVYTNDNATLNDGVYEYDLADTLMAQVAERVCRKVFGDLPDAIPPTP